MFEHTSLQILVYFPRLSVHVSIEHHEVHIHISATVHFVFRNNVETLSAVSLFNFKVVRARIRGWCGCPGGVSNILEHIELCHRKMTPEAFRRLC